MDAFYASIEQRDFPQYKGKPLVVGGSPTGRGVVATASYEARQYGIHSAMSARKALDLCPHAIFVKPRFEVYKKVSTHIRGIFSRFTDLIEPLSLDEAYLDVTDDKLAIGSAIEIARQIKFAIKDELNLTASAGISINKFVAKIASDLQKPDGLTFIGPSKIHAFMESLPVHKFHGIGKVTAAKMHGMQIFTGADLKSLDKERLNKLFGKAGLFYYNIVRGIDNRLVQPHRQTKSIGTEDTFETDLSEMADMILEIEALTEKTWKRCVQKDLFGRTLTLKIKFSDFKQITRNSSRTTAYGLKDELLAAVKVLLQNAPIAERKVRLLGVSVSNFYDTMEPNVDAGGQLKLF